MRLTAGSSSAAQSCSASRPPRAEGSLLLASLLLVDVRLLLSAARRHIGAAVLSTCALLGLVAVHVYLCFPSHVAPGQGLPSVGTFTMRDVLRAGLFSEDFNDPIFVRRVGCPRVWSTSVCASGWVPLSGRWWWCGR
jgi:hypothetical protein